MEQKWHVDTILPEDFDGVFRFTNNSDEDFVGKWDSKEYLYPAKRTTPMILVNASPLEIQNIRKKFAKDWAVREFFKGEKGAKLQGQEKNADGTPKFNSIHMAAGYTDSDLATYIQMCLEPLQEGKAKILEAKKEPVEEKLSRDEEGNLVTEAVDKKLSLRKRALETQ